MGLTRLCEDLGWPRRGRSSAGRPYGTALRSISPKAAETCRCHFGIAHRVLYLPVPEVILQCPRVVSVVSELEAAGVSQHVRVDGERKIDTQSRPRQHLRKTARGQRRAALAKEHEP